MLIHSASQLLTLPGGPQRGRELGRLGIIPNGAVLVRGGKIAAVGSTAELRADFPNEPALDAGGKVVMPGFVDPHTHLVWAGDRAAEFEMRLEGKTYLEIMAAGGGIVSTVRATRQASLETLKDQTRARMRSLLRHGTTTAEAKTGYGLETQSELHQMQVLLELDAEGGLELVPTFLGAHAIPQETKDNPQAFTDQVVSEMLPALHAWWQAHGGQRPLPYVDVFCETGAFSLEQSRQILTAAKALGFPLKIHADEFDNLGGASLAAELGAASADHLVKTSAADIAALARSNTVAVALPCTPFGLADPHYTPARAILEADGLLAVASDINPGTAWCESMQFVIALACRYLRLTPAQAVAAATINAAAAVGRAERVGSLELGKQADLLILSVDDYRHLGYRFGTNLVQTVIKRGQILPA
ncbi:imidazolonepropionase [Levilinea saccharolytica]|uniref:Imidazolonepropionase n=1 Tax=Levilinea saccharolytica TaxID=229921 RepID=A0A0M9U355_9CHLR|nr:imidazolonepropionase [Levilinea saccharolytica]KPL80886.1 imidazolonepropionase [Levilinea saccharolytica]GAP19344.1 imidazolonepropionase [Levilinea saccharolytica]